MLPYRAVCLSFCLSVTLAHPVEAIGRNEVKFANYLPNLSVIEVCLGYGSLYFAKDGTNYITINAREQQGGRLQSGPWRGWSRG